MSVFEKDRLVEAYARVRLYTGTDPWDSLASSFRASLIGQAQDFVDEALASGFVPAFEHDRVLAHLDSASAALAACPYGHEGHLCCDCDPVRDVADLRAAVADQAGPATLSPEDRLTIQRAVEAMTGYLAARGENDLSSVLNSVEKTVVSLIERDRASRTRQLQADHSTAP